MPCCVMLCCEECPAMDVHCVLRCVIQLDTYLYLYLSNFGVFHQTTRRHISEHDNHDTQCCDDVKLCTLSSLFLFASFLSPSFDVISRFSLQDFFSRSETKERVMCGPRPSVRLSVCRQLNRLSDQYEIQNRIY